MEQLILGFYLFSKYVQFSDQEKILTSLKKKKREKWIGKVKKNNLGRVNKMG